MRFIVITYNERCNSLKHHPDLPNVPGVYFTARRLILTADQYKCIGSKILEKGDNLEKYFVGREGL
jgi:hypothetical protein